MARPHISDQLRKFTPATLPTLDALRQQGRTYLSIATALGVSYATVYRAVNRQDTYKGMQ